MKQLNVLFCLIIQIFSHDIKKEEIISLDLKLGNKIKTAEKGFLSKFNIFTNKNNKSSVKIGKITKIPSYSISSIKTNIFVRKNNCDAEIKEEVSFIISNGVFSTLSRKISLDGSSNTMYGFKLISS